MAKCFKQKQEAISKIAQKLGFSDEFPHEKKLQQLLRERERLLREREQYYSQKYESDMKKISEYFKKLGKTHEEIVHSYIQRVDKLSFQGGFGHAFKYYYVCPPNFPSIC